MKHDVYKFVNAPDNVKADMVVCLDAFKVDGLMLEHCAEDVQKHRSIVLEAVKNNAEAFLFRGRESPWR